MPDEVEDAQEDEPLSENARKFVDLIVRIIVNTTLREVGMENNVESIQKQSSIKRSKRGSNKNKRINISLLANKNFRPIFRKFK